MSTTIPTPGEVLQGANALQDRAYVLEATGSKREADSLRAVASWMRQAVSRGALAETIERRQRR